MNIRKAFAVVELVVVISLFVVGAFTGVKYFGKTAGSVKGTPIENVQKIEDKKAADDAKAQGKIDVETQSQLNTAQAGAHATVEAINQADIKNTAGQNPSREIKTAKEVAQMTQDAIDAGLNQPVDPKLMKWFMDVINKKNSDIERERQIGESMLQIKSNELIASTVVGGASRLFQYFISKYLPSNVITYADKRFSDGGLYNHLGFNLVRESNPNYFYMKHNNLESRMKYQKHKLQNILPIYDANKTELQNMWDNDYRILYDCGNLVFKWNRGEQDVNIQNYDTMHYTKREL